MESVLLKYGLIGLSLLYTAKAAEVTVITSRLDCLFDNRRTLSRSKNFLSNFKSHIRCLKNTGVCECSRICTTT
jgi:hypothetical protein